MKRGKTLDMLNPRNLNKDISVKKEKLKDVENLLKSILIIIGRTTEVLYSISMYLSLNNSADDTEEENTFCASFMDAEIKILKRKM